MTKCKDQSLIGKHRPKSNVNKTSNKNTTKGRRGHKRKRVDSVASIVNCQNNPKRLRLEDTSGKKRNKKNVDVCQKSNVNETQKHLERPKVESHGDNGYNLSNIVPPNFVLRSILHEIFPILYLPEYISRRRNAEIVEMQKMTNDHCKDGVLDNVLTPEENSQLNVPSNIICQYKKLLSASSMKGTSRMERNEDYNGKSTLIQQLEKTDGKNNNNHASGDDGCIKRFVRAIVIPLKSSLIDKVAYPITATVHVPEQEVTTTSKRNDNIGDIRNHKPTNGISRDKMTLTSSSFSSQNGDNNQSIETKTVVVNTYAKQRQHHSTKLFCVNESPIALIDEVISTLVHKRQREKRKGNSHSSSNWKKKKRKYNQMKNDITSLSYNELCLGRNVLAEGFTLDAGIQCTKVNSCVSFARSSPIIRGIHTLLGDNLARELLLHSIILIPVVDSDTSNNGKSKTKNSNHNINDDRLSIDKGNYFQLCGPPLSYLNTSARPDQGHHIQEPLQKKTKSSPDTMEGKKLSPPSQQLNPHWVIPRASIFYSESYIPKVGLTQSHMLNQYDPRNPNDGTADKLLDAIVRIQHETNKNKRRKRRKRLRSQGIVICSEILRRQKQCDYKRFLDKYCPLPYHILNQCNEDINTDDDNIANLAKCCSPPKNVISFVSAILKHVFPIEFWGSEYNFRIVLDIMKSFIRLRRLEQFCLKNIMNGLKTLDIQWLFHTKSKTLNRKKKSKSDHDAATTLIQNQMKWLYCSFIIPLIRSTFYATETAFTGKQIHYYRKPVWSKLRSLSIDQLLKKQYKLINKEEALIQYNRQPFGFSRLRLLPKKTGFRPISLCSRIENPKFSIKPLPKCPTNLILKPSLDVLRYEYSLDKSRFGVGLAGYNQFYNKMKTFAMDLKKLSRRSNIDKIPPLYFCSVDIKKCYDNIRQDYLFSIMTDIVQEESYLIQQNTILFPGDKERLYRKRVKNVGRPDMLSTMSSFADNAITKNFTGAIIVDNAQRKTITKDDLLNQLEMHVLSNVVVSRQKYGPIYLSQRSGIPQGSVLSTTLCNYYYGHGTIEDSSNQGLLYCDAQKEVAHLLVRIVDDFLLITTSKRASQKFMVSMLKGNPSLGVRINETKSRVSHDTLIPDGTLSNQNQKSLSGNLVSKGKDSYFPWCGLLINTKTCSILVDYSRFAGSSAIDSLTIDRENEGLRLQFRMRSFIRPRCLPIFFDFRINAKSEIFVNFFQAVTYATIKSLNYISQGMDGGIEQNPKFIFHSMIDMVQYAIRVIHSSLRNFISNEACARSAFTIDTEDALWLGTHSIQYVTKTSKHRECRLLCDYLRIFKERLKPTSRVRYLSRLGNTAISKFDIQSFRY